MSEKEVDLGKVRDLIMYCAELFSGIARKVLFVTIVVFVLGFIGWWIGQGRLEWMASSTVKLLTAIPLIVMAVFGVIWYFVSRVHRSVEAIVDVLAVFVQENIPDVITELRTSKRMGVWTVLRSMGKIAYCLWKNSGDIEDAPKISAAVAFCAFPLTWLFYLGSAAACLLVSAILGFWGLR